MKQMQLGDIRGGKKNHRWGIVLAGGEGRRVQQFLKTQYGHSSPKQYCAIMGTRSMLRHTIDRAKQVISDDQILTVVARDHISYATKDLYDRPGGTVVIQPMGKETTPGILLPLLHIFHQDPQARVAVFPSDHFIREEGRFMDYVWDAFSFATAFPGYINILGVTPDRLEDGYGWIERGDIIGHHWETELYHVKRFLEKPDLRELSKEGCENFLWNTLTMVGHISTFLNLIRLLAPEIYKPMQRIAASLGTSFEQDVTEEVYDGLPVVNFSRSILERSTRYLSVLPISHVYWSDWGDEGRITSDIEQFGYASMPQQLISSTFAANG